MTRTIRFFDGNYICCSTYGKPRSKDFHWKYFKQLLQENDLPDIRWHDLRATYCTILLKNDFNPKAVSKMMGHAKEIITIDVYGDKQEIIEDCLEALEPFKRGYNRYGKTAEVWTTIGDRIAGSYHCRRN